MSGDNGLIQSVINAKEQSEIGDEKEILNLATVYAMNKNKYGDVTKSGLQKGLDNYFGNRQAKVTDNENGLFLVVFPSGRAYEVDADGNGTYLGTEDDLLTKVVITADKESNSTPVLVQEVKVSVRTYIPIEDEDIILIYAWSKSKDEIPADEDFVMADLSGTKLNRIATVYSNVTDAGEYYLWVKAIINELENPKSFGEYAIKEFTTLRSCASENTSTSYFLGSNQINSDLKRNVIKSVTISSSLQGHQAGVSNCWDVSESQKGSILAWYTESVVDDVSYYDVTIAEDGGVVANVNSSWLFSNIGYGVNSDIIISGLDNLDTSLTKSMWSMFYNCKGLTSLDVSNFNTRKAKSMYQMFLGCRGLSNLDVSNFNTENVNTMHQMFYNCRSLTRLDVRNFNTENVHTMSYMFAYCNNLSSLEVNHFDTSKVTNMYYMFSNCSSVTDLDVSKFNTANVTNMDYMFSECSSLTSLDISNFTTTNVTNMAYMFGNCKNLTSLDISNFNTSKVTNMEYIFGACSGLTSLDVSYFNTSNVTRMYMMFHGCSGLTSLNVSNFDTSNVTTMGNMFSNCSQLTSLDISNFDTSNVTNISMMFSHYSQLTSLNLRNLNICKVTSSSFTFSGLSKDIFIYVSTEEMKEWILAQNSSFTNIQVEP